MKFKSILTDQLCMKDFLSIVSTFSRLSKRIIFIVKKNGLCISNVGICMGTNPIAWSNIPENDFFSNFQMKGVDEDNDEIWLAMHPEQLTNALITLRTHFIKVIVIKLTKKQFPCLSIDIELAPPNSNNFRRLMHDVPVSVIPTNEWKEYHIPNVSNDEFSIKMPSLKSLRTLCDKMKNMSSTMTVCCISSGDLSFIVETDSSVVVSRYFNLIGSNMNTINGTHREKCCKIDTKHLSLCFGSTQMSNVQMVGSILQEKAFGITIDVRQNVQLFFMIYCPET